MIERLPDRILTRKFTTTADGKRITTDESILMPLPKNAGRFYHDVPEGIKIIDMRQNKIDPSQTATPHLTIEGDIVGGAIDVPLQNGVGAVEIQPGKEVVVYAKDLTQKLKDISDETRIRRIRFGW